MNEKIREAIEKQFNQKIVDEQLHPWGEIYWLQLDNQSGKPQRTVSLVSIYPDMEQKVHTHAGYEEIIFGLKGESVHWNNEQQFVLGVGQLGYIPAGSQHSMLNGSDQSCQFLSIVNPTIPAALASASPIEEINLKEVAAAINLDAIAERFASSVGLAVTLVDDTGSLLTEPKNLPEFCKICLQDKCGNCVICPDGVGHSGNDLREFRCKFGISSIESPIIINKRLLGYLICGYVRVFLPATADELYVSQNFSPALRPLARQAYINMDMGSRNHLKSVAETLSLVSVSLVQMMIDSSREKQINSYKLNLSREKRLQAELENSLNEARLKFLESQVNPHFLFNTLNTIAQTSVMEGAKTAASLTYALANLLRCNLGKTDSLISIREELAYIKDYMVIQTTRFPGKFKIVYDITEDVLDVKIPFMTLMTLVENSFKHGFSGIRWQGVLEITGCQSAGRAIIQVRDNGTGIPAELRESMHTGETGWNYQQLSANGIGLKNIYKRLEYYFGADFKFNLQSDGETGTAVTIELPVKLPEKS